MICFIDSAAPFLSQRETGGGKRPWPQPKQKSLTALS